MVLELLIEALIPCACMLTHVTTHPVKAGRPQCLVRVLCYYAISTEKVLISIFIVFYTRWLNGSIVILLDG